LVVFAALFDTHRLPLLAVCLLLAGKLLQPTPTDWQMFFRADVRLALPNDMTRFAVLLGGILVNRLVVEDMIAVYFVFAVIYGEASVGAVLVAFIAYVLIFACAEAVQFLLLASSPKVKAVFSAISYSTSMAVTAGVTFIVLRSLAALVLSADWQVFGETPVETIKALWSRVLTLSDRFSAALATDQWLVTGGLAAAVVLCAVTTAGVRASLRAFGSRDAKSHAPCLSILRAFTGASRHGAAEPRVVSALVGKEFSLLDYMYRVTFAEYWFTLLFDRSFAYLVGMWLALRSVETNIGYLVFFCSSVVLFILEVSSTVGVKLLANMSFIADYGTLRLANLGGASMSDIVKAKLRFYYRLRVVPTAGLYGAVMVGLWLLSSPWVALLAWTLAWGAVFVCYPAIHLTNNIVLFRMDYREPRKYLDESSLLDIDIDDFFPLSVTQSCRVVSAVVLIVLSALWMAPLGALLLWVGILAVSVVTDTSIMWRVRANALASIERGEYTVNVAKILSKDRDSA
jgi:hypothetical protein